jgi:RNA polymerase subunit RPABC4/transcription elongation factor Spt4
MALIKCTECGGTISDTATTCPHCGAPIIKCKECGRILPEGSSMCPYCGAPADVVYEKDEKKTPLPKQGGEKSSIGKIILAVMVIFVFFLIVTCPGEDKHQEVLEDHINLAVKEMFDSTAEKSVLSGIDDEMIVNQITKTLVSSQFSVNNYLICSVGKVYFLHQKIMVTFGVANHVFCLVSKGEIKRNIEKWEKIKKGNASDFFSIIKNIFGSGNSEDADSYDAHSATENVQDNSILDSISDDAPDADNHATRSH